MASAIIRLILSPYDTSRRVRAKPTANMAGQRSNKYSQVFEPLVSVVLSMSFMVLQFSTLDGKNADLLFGLLWSSIPVAVS